MSAEKQNKLSVQSVGIRGLNVYMLLNMKYIYSVPEIKRPVCGYILFYRQEIVILARLHDFLIA